jgi:hypothetical protein
MAYIFSLAKSAFPSRSLMASKFQGARACATIAVEHRQIELSRTLKTWRMIFLQEVIVFPFFASARSE